MLVTEYSGVPGNIDVRPELQKSLIINIDSRVRTYTQEAVYLPSSQDTHLCPTGRSRIVLEVGIYDYHIPLCIGRKDNLSLESQLQRAIHPDGHTHHSPPSSCMIIQAESGWPVGV